jgi:hypothetical protein
MRLTLLCALALLSTAAPASAESNPAKVRLTEKSGNGAVLIRVPPQPYPYALQFSKNGHSGFMSRVYLMGVKPGTEWIARTLGPGRYRLDSMWQEGHWSACLEAGTFEFDVKSGRIEYVGTLDTQGVLTSLQDQATAAGQTSQAGTAYYLSHGKTKVPPLGDRDEAGLAAARSFAEAGMNGSGGLLELAPVRDVAFGTSGTGKAIKVCG